MDCTIFIGSSSEQIDEMERIAAAIDSEPGFRAVTWNRMDMFTPGEYTLESLIHLTKDIDAAVFIFGPDDIVEFRGEQSMQPRDNVLIEYGLFLGKLGKSNVVFYRKSSTRTARDVDGVTYIDAPSGWNHAVQQRMKSWLKNINDNKFRMSEHLERILYPAIEFSLRFPPDNRASVNPEPILTDINEEGKKFFGILMEEEFLGKSTGA